MFVHICGGGVGHSRNWMCAARPMNVSRFFSCNQGKQWERGTSENAPRFDISGSSCSEDISDECVQVLLLQSGETSGNRGHPKTRLSWTSPVLARAPGSAFRKIRERERPRCEFEAADRARPTKTR